MPRQPNWSAYAGYWVALVKGNIVGVGRTAQEAFLAAKAARRREEPNVVYVASANGPDGVQGEIFLPAQERFPRVSEKPVLSPYWSVPPLIAELAGLVQSWDAPAYLVGGTVRDVLLGRETHDLDVAAGGDALALGRSLADRLDGAYFPLDEERGVARVIFAREGKQIFLDVAALRGAGIDDDLRMRDFTVNAMALPLDDLRRESVLDPAGGLGDLAAGTLRAVSEASLRDDPARLMRGVRLSAELSLSMDAATEACLAAEASLLSQVSPERIRDELNRMLILPDFGRCVREMERFGLLAVILPEMDGLRGMAQPLPHTWDGLEHTIRTVEAAEEAVSVLAGGGEAGTWAAIAAELSLLQRPLAQYLGDSLAPQQSRLAMLKLGALLHDTGKPETRTEDKGRIRFLGHPKAGARLATQALYRLRYSAAAVRMVSALVGQHMWLLSLVRLRQVSNRSLYRFHRALGDAAIAAGILFLADIRATRPHSEEPSWVAAQAVVSRVLHACLAEPEIVAPVPVVSGHALMEAFSLEGGPMVGWLLEGIREAQAMGLVKTPDEALAHAARMLDRRRRTEHENR